MSQPTPQEFRETVRSHTDIVSLIGETIALQPRRGGEHVGLCPFHEDHNPSLRVYAARQTFRCWSCATGGDCFTFVMEREKVTFPEALEILARRANLPIPKRSAEPTVVTESRPKIFEVLQWAENELHKALLELPVAEPARQYLKESRGFTDETISKYRLGFHPDNWTWLLEKAAGKYPVKLLQEARLIGERDGRHFDFFVNRVIFPIHNERGQPVSFGGRVLPGSRDDAKYWNGPESIVFHKSRLLYALDRARDAITKEKQALVVEGYTDCITCHQYGVMNVVGTLGTALTDSHVAALKRFTHQVVLVFDGDDAGQRAAQKAVERFLAQDMNLRILTLPGRLDPAEFLAEQGPDAFRQLVATAPEAWEFQFRNLRRAFGVESIDGRQRILDGMLGLMAKTPSLSGGIRESLFIANLSQRLLLPEQAVRDRLQEIRSTESQRVRMEKTVQTRRDRTEAVARIIRGRISREVQLECDLLEMTLAAPGHVQYVMQCVSDLRFRSEIIHLLLSNCAWEDEEMGQVTVPGLLSRLDDPDLKNLVVWFDEQATAKGLAKKLTDSGYNDDGCPQLLMQAIHNLHWREAEQQQQSVDIQLSQYGSAQYDSAPQSLTRDEAARREQGSSELDDATAQLLLQAAEFHKQRATRKTTA
ncbi:DNA primase [Planctomicrobium sp. SH664]|uniref:DNA primase n=1 Tax=Planctomicrobium sp. SH664 TaxID=3448125 RepID=UPI003F5C5EBF